MNELVLRSVIAGIMFGLWPLMMQRSGLQGNVSSIIFAGAAFLTVLPFAARTGIAPAMQNTNVALGLAAGIIGGVGLLFLNGMLARVSVNKVGAMFAIMILVQLTIPVVYQFVITGNYPAKQIIGALLAVISVLLLV